MECTRSRSHHIPRVVAIVAVLVIGVLGHGAGQTVSSPRRRAEPPRSVRLYVFDCGTLENMDAGRFQLKREEVASNRISVACFLVAHPKGTLIWDTGAVPDTT